MRVLIVGAGIAGLTAAIALRKVNIEVVVYERAPELREVGAGISLWANALTALDRIGAGDDVRARSLRMAISEIRLKEGRSIGATMNGAELERDLGRPEAVRMIHRADLVEALASHLPVGTIRFGHECAGIDSPHRMPRVRFQSGLADTADVVVGADGIRSAVRAALFGAREPRYSGYTTWRGVCPRPAGVTAGYAGEWWGRGKRIGITTIPGERVYWFAVENAPAHRHLDDPKAHLLRTFGHWAEPAPALLASTPREQILANDIYDRPPSDRWSAGCVVLIGDAIHPTTPNLGQGGCMAIEDGVVLARHLASASEPSTSLAAFARERHPRTAAIVNESWRFGQLAQIENGFLCALRDTAVAALARIAGPSQALRHVRFDAGPLDSTTHPS